MFTIKQMRYKVLTIVFIEIQGYQVINNINIKLMQLEWTKMELFRRIYGFSMFL
jgi:hypothetical protein